MLRGANVRKNGLRSVGFFWKKKSKIHDGPDKYKVTNYERQCEVFFMFAQNFIFEKLQSNYLIFKLLKKIKKLKLTVVLSSLSKISTLKNTMRRRIFLKKTAQAAPLILLTPSALLTACGDDPKPGVGKKVVVVGAGLAGIYAAHLLLADGYEVTTLEASDRWGGRVRVLEGFADFPIELGGEEVHGEKTDWYNLVRDAGAEFADDEEEDVFWIGGLRRTEAQVSADPSGKAVFDLVEASESYAGADQTVAAWAVERGIAPAWRPLANALLGNEHGTANSRLSAKYLAEENNLWAAGEKNFLLTNRSYKQVVEQQMADAVATIRLSSPVKSIDYTAEMVKITDAAGQAYEADAVVVTVPLPILRDGDIAFLPALPTTKTAAMQKIGMGAGMKIILKFSTRFWPPDLGSLYTDGSVPEFWFTSRGRGSTPVLTAFVMGEKAEALSALGSAAVAQVLGELDAIFGAAGNTQPATNSFVDAHVMDWSKEPFVRGAYSYPVVGGGVAQRAALAEPVGGKVFFAGEATHTEGHNGSMHGALESAKKAVDALRAG
jgi:monoamine oxidase